MWRWTSGETRANVLRETASPRTLSPLIRTPIWTVFHARAAFQELSQLPQLPQLHPDHVLMRRRDEGVEAAAREWAARALLLVSLRSEELCGDTAGHAQSIRPHSRFSPPHSEALEVRDHNMWAGPE